ncbi:MAG: hypothetical protein AABN34_04810 [Acidobacteriota bacterium]
MSSLLSYLTEKRSLLADNYEANCLTIARDIARLLIDSGNQPFIACLHKETVRPGYRFHHPLIPKKYYGSITWTKHYVCCCEGVVYDPMLEEPVGIEQYSRAAFGEDFPLESFVPKEAMEGYMGRYSF